MEQQSFNKLLLKTAFSCMACDGDIDNREIDLIRRLAIEQKIFGDIVIDSALNQLLEEINEDGQLFLKGFFSELTNANLSEEDELKIIQVAISTINADEIIEYSEIKFFKIIRSKLKVKNDKILNVLPDIEEYLEQDIISKSYLARLQDDFFSLQAIPKFASIQSIDTNLLNDASQKKQ